MGESLQPQVDDAGLVERPETHLVFRNSTGYRSSEAELSAVRKLNPFGTCD
jgi:hypothetical protein